jgi:hypothetical protein
MRNQCKPRGIVTGVLVAVAATGGCGSSPPKSTEPRPGGQMSMPSVDPTLCDIAGKNVLTYDLNRDQRPDVWRLYKVDNEGGTRVEHLTCKQVDYDHDGRKDWVVGFNRRGGRLFERADMNYDGLFDLSAVYDPRTGNVGEIERDSNFDGKFDLIEAYDTTGRLTSVRQDADHNGKPEAWEQYKEGVLIAILYDDNGDGKVDRREDVPGSRPKIEMPTPEGGPTEGELAKPEAAKPEAAKPEAAKSE